MVEATLKGYNNIVGANATVGMGVRIAIKSSCEAYGELHREGTGMVTHVSPV